MKALCLLGWACAIAIASGDPNPREPGTPAPVRKVVRQYALTSANDFPQRDPRDWRLLGSNDDGQNWTTLDTRKGELFSQRQQRRLFQIAHPGAFNLYRLQIDRVRDPSGADSVQLSELEAMGETEEDLDPTPADTDSITAQGAKAPAEVAYNAFDGDIETKWLDFAVQNRGSRASWIGWQYSSAPTTGLVITNLQQLARLRAHARQGYTVRIEGVLAGRLSGAHGVSFLDQTGSLQIPEVDLGEQFRAGQQVLLEGTSQWINKQAGVSQPRLEARGPRAPVSPRSMALESPLALDEDFQWVQVEGQVGFVARPDARLVFELEEAERSVRVRVLQPVPADQRLPEGRVQVRGLCGGILGAKGKRVLGVVWVPSLAEVVPLSSAQLAPNSDSSPKSASTNPPVGPVLTDIGRIYQLSREQLAARPRVNIRGVATFGGYIQEGNDCIETYRGDDELQLGQNFVGDYLEAAGRAVWISGRGLVIKADNIVVLGKGKLPNPERPSWNQLAGGKGLNQWIELQGVVRATDGSHLLLSCEGGRLMATIRTAPAHRVEELVDAAVRMRGVAVAATDDRGQVQGIQLLVPSLEYVQVQQEPADPFSLPVRPIESLLQVKPPQEPVHRVKIEGVLTCQDGRKLFLQDASGSAMALTKEDVMLKTESGLWHWVFWQSPKTEAESTNQLEFKVGDKLQIAGFPETGGQAPVLTEALVRKVAHSGATPAVTATVSDILLGRHDSALVTLEGRVLGREMVGRDLVIQLQSEEKVFQAILRAATQALANLPAASRVRVTGVCQIEPVPYAGLGLRVSAFKLMLRSPADLAVLERPPWWNLRHTLIAGGALAAVLAAAVGWIWILRRQVEERTKRLKHEIEEHRKTEGQLAEETRRVQSEVEEHKRTEQSLAEKTDLLKGEIEERKRVQAEFERVHRQLLVSSRLAGMAEVATSVLHNVGNVLNGANLLASSIEKQVHQSQAPGVSRLAALLAERQADLGQFLAQDERGSQVCGHLGRLGAQLTTEQTRLVEKTRLLSESIQHIKEIVAMQQNYARIYGVTETAALSEIVEDAVQMCSGAVGWPDLELVRDYAPVPAAALDRHRVLQILFNLLENARQACEAQGGNGGRITVRLRLIGQDRVQAQVSDNGIGIPAENLPRIFTQGFSTRKGGHGFGLHSSVLAAQDMGGSLTVQSDGPGRGATFTLELPVLHRRETARVPGNGTPPPRGQP